MNTIPLKDAALVDAACRRIEDTVSSWHVCVTSDEAGNIEIATPNSYGTKDEAKLDIMDRILAAGVCNTRVTKTAIYTMFRVDPDAGEVFYVFMFGSAF